MDDLTFGLLAGYPGDHASLERSIERSVWAENNGYDFVGLGDRVVWRQPTVDTFVAAAQILGATTKVKFGFVFVAPLRHPVITAKMVGTLEQISQGRVLLWPGIGGDYPHEFRNLGIEVSERVGRTEETLEIMRRLWNEEDVTYEGRYYSVHNLTLSPSCVQPGGPPYWFAHRGRAEASIDRTVRLCDGWLASWVSAPRFERVWRATIERAQEAGRDPNDLVPAAVVRMIVADSKAEARKQAAAWRAEMYGHAKEPTLMEHLLPLGTVDDCADSLQDFVNAGARHFMLSSPLHEDSWDEQFHAFKEVIRKVQVR